MIYLIRTQLVDCGYFASITLLLPSQHHLVKFHGCRAPEENCKKCFIWTTSYIRWAAIIYSYAIVDHMSFKRRADAREFARLFNKMFPLSARIMVNVRVTLVNSFGIKYHELIFGSFNFVPFSPLSFCRLVNVLFWILYVNANPPVWLSALWIHPRLKTIKEMQKIYRESKENRVHHVWMILQARVKYKETD